MNDLVKFGGGNLPAKPEDLIAGLQHVSAGLSGRSGGTPYLRLLKSGVFAYGQEDIEPQQGSQWAINPHSFQHGFACWGDGELFGEAMVPLNQPPPNINDLQDFGADWDQQISFQLQCLNGEDTGVTVLYKSTSVGFLNMAKQLIDQMVLQLQGDPTNYVPVVELDMGHYHHKQWGKTYFPVLDVLRWMPIEGGGDEMTKGEEAGHEGDEPTESENPAPRESAKKPQPRKAADKPAATRARRGAVTEEPIQPNVVDDAAVDAVVDEMEGKMADTTGQEKPTRSRRRRAG
jgi:hypothetical protein